MIDSATRLFGMVTTTFWSEQHQEANAVHDAADDGLTEPGDRAAERLALAHAPHERAQDLGDSDGDREDDRDLENGARRLGEARREPPTCYRSALP
jgi:hypothetical protein